MRLALIGCMVLNRDLSYCISSSENFIHPFWIEQGLHNTPALLNQKLQQTINEIEQLYLKQKADNDYPDTPFDAIVLGYGLCSNGVLGLKSSILPIIVPRTDDCIALFLGSQQKYLDYFNNSDGIYWYLKPWMANNSMPSKEYYDFLYNKYLEEHDEDTAEFLIEQLTEPLKSYEYAYFIRSQIYNDENECSCTKKIAEHFNWKFKEISADLSMLEDLLFGNWDDRFLVNPPNHEIVANYDGLKFESKEIEKVSLTN